MWRSKQYIFDRFGKFPGTVPSMIATIYLQAHHLDLDRTNITVYRTGPVEFKSFSVNSDKQIPIIAGARTD